MASNRGIMTLAGEKVESGKQNNYKCKQGSALPDWDRMM
jgi:hypothetical protein